MIADGRCGQRLQGRRQIGPERQLGRQLFLCRHSGLMLTPAGQTLLVYADRLLQLSTEAQEALQQGCRACFGSALPSARRRFSCRPC